jgi:hypothetical protein
MLAFGLSDCCALSADGGPSCCNDCLIYAMIHRSESFYNRLQRRPLTGQEADETAKISVRHGDTVRDRTKSVAYVAC